MGSPPRVLMLLYLVNVALVLQMFLTWSEAQELNDTQSSIDQDILKAYLSSNNSLRMNHPSFVRVQLDMLFLADVYAGMINTPHSKRRMRRTAMQDESLRWPNATVPYAIEASFTAKENVVLREAMNDYQSYSCIRFREKLPDDVDYVRITDDNGCSSWVGRLGGRQTLSLSMWCRKKGVIMHELGHVLGLVHEHARPDRDQYVNINFPNILNDFRNDFMKFNESAVNVSGIPYDYQSIMHYGEKMASANNEVVIETKDSSYQKTIGQSNTLSFRDVKLLNMMYRCSDQCRSQIPSCPGEGFMGSDCRCWCPSGRKEIAAVHCPDIECGGILVGSGTIRSPNFTGVYRSNANCTWMLQPATDNGGISLVIRHFSIDPCCEFVRIFDSSRQQLLLTGTIIKPPFLSLETSANVTFTTNGSPASNGFEIAFSTISSLAGTVGNQLTFPKDNNGVCGGALVGSGIIRSPNFPNSYRSNMRCVWTVRALSATGWISLEILRFLTESCCDFVKISDNAGQQLVLSGEMRNRLIILRSPATIYFTTDYSLTDIGFEIVFNTTSILPDRSSCQITSCPSNGFVGNDCQCWCPSGRNETAAVLCPECPVELAFCKTFASRGWCSVPPIGMECRSCGYCS